MAAGSSSENERILIFEPHPDDVAFQISGSVFKWIRGGKEVMICTVTSGNNSTFDPKVTSNMIADIMAKEHRAAMELLGLDGEHLVQWNYDDLGLDPGRDREPLLRDMVQLIRTFKPATVVTMDPKNMQEEENPDHRLVAMTGFEAAAMAAYPNVFREQFNLPGAAPHFVARVLFHMSPEPDTFIDIGGAPLEMKIRLCLVYKSQLDLMLTEGKQRLAGLGVALPMFDLPGDIVWPEVCRQIARDAADACRKIYPERKDTEFAEAFRLQYLGVVHKMRSFLPGTLELQ